MAGVARRRHRRKENPMLFLVAITSGLFFMGTVFTFFGITLRCWPLLGVGIACATLGAVSTYYLLCGIREEKRAREKARR
jgi:membrane protein YqaA with SNARE-associated domain